MRRLSLLPGLLLIGGILLSCSKPPQLESPTPPQARKFNYLGEIKGEFGDLELSLPVAIAFDLSKNAYVVDQGNNRVIKMTPEGKYDKDNGGYGLGINGLSHPVSLESDGGISFFILDQGNNRIVRSDYNLVFSDEIRFANNPDLQLAGKIADIAFSRYGNMYLVDTDNLKVIMLDKDYAREQELFPAGGFSRCTLVTAAEDGSVYVYDRERDGIYVFDAFGNAKGEIGLPDIGILGDFVVHMGLIIATDKERHELIAFDLQGRPVMAAGSFGSGPLNLNAPTGIGVRGDNKIYVCDSGNNRIVIYEIAAQLP
jgi:DNA-binding beta-propeller fold protein YncE